MTVNPKHYTRLEKPAKDKHSSLLRTFENYGCKKFDNTGPSSYTLFSYESDI